MHHYLILLSLRMSAHKKNDTQKEGAQCSLYHAHATAINAAPHRIIFC